MLRRQRLQHDMVVVLVNDGSRPFVDLKIFSQPSWDHDLSLTVNDTVSVFCVELMMNNTTSCQNVSQQF